ncbi:MAG: hypothetical protein WBA46_01810 [Thermomicrobiales bacterium]
MTRTPLFTTARDVRLFDIGYQVGMHFALNEQGMIPESDVLEELTRDHTITLDGAGPGMWDAYWLGRQIGFDAGYAPEILACFSEGPQTEQIAS